MDIMALIILFETSIIIFLIILNIKCNCLINRYFPSFFCTIISIPFCYILSGYDGASSLGCSILLSISLALTVLVISYMLFPRIVVTIDNNNQNSAFVLWADGKKIYERGKNGYPIKNSATRQFTFQVWRKGEYDLYLECNKDSTKSVNTYDHHVCHVRFDKKRK